MKNIKRTKFQNLMEGPPSAVFRKGDKSGFPFSDEDLRAQMRDNKLSNLFGPEVPYEKQSQEYRDAKEELDRRAAEKEAATKAATRTTVPASSRPTEESPEWLYEPLNQPLGGMRPEAGKGPKAKLSPETPDWVQGSAATLGVTPEEMEYQRQRLMAMDYDTFEKEKEKQRLYREKKAKEQEELKKAREAEQSDLESSGSRTIDDSQIKPIERSAGIKNPVLTATNAALAAAAERLAPTGKKVMDQIQKLNASQKVIPGEGTGSGYGTHGGMSPEELEQHENDIEKALAFSGASWDPKRNSHVRRDGSPYTQKDMDSDISKVREIEKEYGKDYFDVLQQVNMSAPLLSDEEKEEIEKQRIKGTQITPPFDIPAGTEVEEKETAPWRPIRPDDPEFIQQYGLSTPRTPNGSNEMKKGDSKAYPGQDAYFDRETGQYFRLDDKGVWHGGDIYLRGGEDESASMERTRAGVKRLNADRAKGVDLIKQMVDMTSSLLSGEGQAAPAPKGGFNASSGFPSAIKFYLDKFNRNYSPIQSTPTPAPTQNVVDKSEEKARDEFAPNKATKFDQYYENEMERQRNIGDMQIQSPFKAPGYGEGIDAKTADEMLTRERMQRQLARGRAFDAGVERFKQVVGKLPDASSKVMYQLALEKLKAMIDEERKRDGLPKITDEEFRMRLSTDSRFNKIK